jgi:trypsin
VQTRAFGLVALFIGLTILPLAAGEPDPNCAARMMREMGWDIADLPSSDALSVGGGGNDTHLCTGKIQPGSLMSGGGCTMNFIFRDQLARYYFGTAAHCTSGVGATYGVSGVGNNIATVVYDGGPTGNNPDFALLRVDPAFYSFIDPTLCHWGGPTGVNTVLANGETTFIYGYGTLYSTTSATRARGPGIVNDEAYPGMSIFNPAIEQAYNGQAQAGDSGAPIVTGDGKAAGIHVRSYLTVVFRVDPVGKVMTRVDAAMAAASVATGLQLQLVDGTLPFSLTGT